MDERDRIIEKQSAIIAEQSATIAEQSVTIAKLQIRIQELERRLNLDSTNSSKPPSSDGLRKKPSPQSLRQKSEKPSGGQEGHKGCTLEQVAEPTKVISHRVETCQNCGKSLVNQDLERVIKRQIFDIPEPKIEVTEHQAEVKQCTCGYCNTALFPSDVRAPVQYGPRVKAFAIYLSTQQLIPEDRLKETFADLFSLPISTATLTSINEKFSTIVEPYQEQVLEELKKAPVKHLDETGLRIAGKTHWLHVISDANQTHYRPSLKRKNLLNNVVGTVVHDHWKPYFQLPEVTHALCNAHHLRELKAVEEQEKEPWAGMMAQFLRLAVRFKNPPVERLSKLYDNILARGFKFHESQPPLDGRKNKRRVGHNLLRRLRKFKPAVLRFLTDSTIPFSNNQAEQDLRMMKVKQKISQGFRTMHGAEIFCTIRGFISTARKQKFNILEAIQSAYG